ncbi:MAG: polynucleotide adenylyltransferase PcnB [Gammaproteobacteria bacterium]|nr:polynucleotide adenylyltransferase PcnB [Gammaproteobacteria bacterium]
MNSSSKQEASGLSSSPTIIARAGHNVSRADINDNALKVLYRLHNAGFKAHLVGGCVRDLLLSLHPKDFDVATDASPEQIKKLFDNCRLIGRRFRLAHILFGRDVVEVATFRGQTGPDDEENEDRRNTEGGMILRDNVYGDIEEDVWRRDFTINALYYNIADFSLIDYIDGMQDIRKRIIRTIGEPEQRYREDPVRMLRALRFSAKLGFKIDSQSVQPIYDMGELLEDIPAARLFDEALKLFHGGSARKTFELLEQYGLLRYLFPGTAECLESASFPFARSLLENVLDNTDERIRQGKSVTPAFLYATFLWLPLLRKLKFQPGDSLPNVIEMQKAATYVIERQIRSTAVPRRFTTMVREIWNLQPRMQRYTGKRALLLLNHPRFRAAYDFLCLRGHAGEAVQDRAEWWTELLQKSAAEQVAMAEALPPEQRTRRRRRRSPRMRARRSGVGTG